MTDGDERPAAPPGSLLWHALQYAPAPARTTIGTVLELERVVQSLSSSSQEHAVAHAKLAWWHEEAARLRAGAPRHPLTRALLAEAQGRMTDWSVLTTALDVARLELAGIALEDEQDLRDYLSRTSVGWHLLAARLAAPEIQPEASGRFAQAIARLLRLTQILLDLPADARAGRVLVPAKWLEDHGLEIPDLYRQEQSGERTRCLARCAELARAAWRDAADCERPVRAALRAQWVLGGLHLALLDRLQEAGFPFDPSTARLSGGRRLLIAWRLARQAT